MTSDQRLERIEANAAHQEAALEDLSDTVRAQWAEIDRLRAEIGKLTRTLESMLEDGEEDERADRKPPHY